jgi:NAD(P)-dependent dehydrogenase (short-subunit alcohol dehydrogenase family)
MDLKLNGKIVLITGGSKGLGLAMAWRFAAEGCDLHLVARSQGLLEAAADAIRRAHQVRVSALPIDLAKAGFAGRVVEACGDVDILINNAGDIPSGSLENVDEARWRAGWDSKVFNYINLSREYFTRMKTRGAGVIINVTGIAGDLRDASYIAGSVGNAAMAAFTKTLGSTSHKFGVRVVGINPGPCATERYEKLARARAQERYGDGERWREAMATLPFGRAASPDEIAAAAVFLASPLSAYTTGAILTIDGGLTGGREIAR